GSVVTVISPRRRITLLSSKNSNGPSGSASGPVTRLGCCVVTTLTTSKRSPTVSRGGTLERVATWSGPFAGGAAGAGADAASAIVSSRQTGFIARPLAPPPGAELEELVQLGREVLVRAQRDAVDAQPGEQPVATRPQRLHVLLVALAQAGV